MIVRWSKNEMHPGRLAKAYRLDAILMTHEQENGDSGSERGEHLASIEERFLKSRELGVRAFHQGIFWSHVDRKLDALDLGAGERDVVEEKIKKKVPRPGKDWELYCVKCIPEIEGEKKRLKKFSTRE
jgi:hypothetical protein